MTSIEPIADKREIARVFQRWPVRCYPYINDVVKESRSALGVEQQIWGAVEEDGRISGLLWLRLNDRRGETRAGVYGEVEGVRALLRRVRKESLPGTELINDPAGAVREQVEEHGSIRFNRLPWELLPVLVSEGFDPEEEPTKVMQFWVTPESYQRPEEIPFEPRRVTKEDIPVINEHWGSDSDSSTYIEACIENGFGFAVDIDGEIAGWNLTHLNGSMGFLHVREPHRGKGIAKSVADSMVHEFWERGNPAVCDVYAGNEASAGLNLSTGFTKLPWHHTWARVVPPLD